MNGGHIAVYMMDTRPVRVGVSACLLGEKVRYDGDHHYDALIVEHLGPHIQWEPVCPEVAMGLGIPRDPTRLHVLAGHIRLISHAGLDHTDAMNRYARHRVSQLVAEEIDGFIVKSGSPSCGMSPVCVYDTDDNPLSQSPGLFTYVLQDMAPHLPVEEDTRLRDPKLRDNFLIRLYAYHRWQCFAHHQPSVADLMQFHADHKYLLLAHEPVAYARLGALVAQSNKENVARTLVTYEQTLMQALRTIPNRNRHANVLQHVAGMLTKDLNRDDRAELAATIEDYRTGALSIQKPLSLIRHHLHHHPHAWIERQAYLMPYPRELAVEI